MQFKLAVFLATLSVLPFAEPYRILCIFPAPSRSHNILGKGIVDSLLNAGHEVTWVTPYPEKKVTPRLKMIGVDTYKIIDSIDVLGHNSMTLVKEIGRNISRSVLMNPEVRETLVKSEFDAVVTEWFFSDSDAGYAAVLKVPWLMLFGSVMSMPMEMMVDDVRSAATLPISFIHNYPVPMNLWQRTVNYLTFFMLTAASRYELNTVTEPFYQELFQPLAKARGVTLPEFLPAFNNVSVLFVNSHSSIAPALSLPPNVVDVAGYHIDANIPPLPKDLQELLDSSKQGVVYFSMGSVLRPTAVFKKLEKDIIKMFSKIPYTILWKFEQNIEGLPKNVHIRSWMPQASILAHPNVRLFITHGGQLSSLEAIYHGVPMLSIPVFGDQPGNAERAVRLGFGQKVDYSPEMVPELTEKLKEMLQNDKYRQKVKEISKIFRNRPVSPSKLVAHYVELAIESKGAYHLRPVSSWYKWYERWMLDVLALAAALLLLTCLLVRRTLRFLVSKITGQKKDKKESKKKKQ